ncbi:MAG: cytochrome D ubiquinol oxidase subunit II, partial [Alphaproteobacteria bacterium]
RLNHCLSKEAIADLNMRFADIVRHGGIVQRASSSEKKHGLEISKLPRLIFTPFRGRFGRLRQLIDAINSSPTI